MRTAIYQVDAFTDRAFAGNPAAVCVLAEPASERWMASVAREMNLSETAFLHPETESYRLRWFTPAVEVELCGHATLAAAHILWEQGYLPEREPARFETRSGLLIASRQDGWIEMDFPARREEPALPARGLVEALKVQPVYVGRNPSDYLIQVESEEEVRAALPDFSRLREVPVRGVILTARSQSDEYDFISRFFAPGSGIDEDSVTGSAHCCLGPFWQERLGRPDLVGYQASPRGGVVRVGVRGDRVLLIGQAVTVLEGELLA